MKKIIFILSTLFICVIAFAETITWHVDGAVYDTTTCEYGGNIDLPTPPTKQGYTFKGWYSGRARIEYIESTGTQYIDTGLTGNLSTEIIMDFMPISLSSTSSVLLVATSADIPRISLVLSGGSTSRWSRFGDSNVYVETVDIVDVNNRYTMKANKEKLILNGNVLGSFNQTIPFTTPYNMHLFFTRTTSFQDRNANIRLYSTKIYDNGTLVRDFVPVLDPSGVACLYDNVTGAYFYNQGTGDFIAGPVVM